MGLAIGLGAAGGADFGINLGRGEAFMAQKLLDHPEVGPAGKKVGGKGVTQKMGIDAGVESSRFGRLFDDAPEVGSGEAATVVAEKHVPSRFGADQLGSGDIEVVLEGFLRDRPEKNEAFLVSFSTDPGATARKVELLDPKGENFRSAQSGCIKKFKESAVAKSERGFGRG
jgi:hypothetical protein